MRDRLEQRLVELRSELAAGQKMSNDLDAKRAELQATMLRIAGAIQVIEEVLQAEPTAAPEPAPALAPAQRVPPPPSWPGNGAESSPG